MYYYDSEKEPPKYNFEEDIFNRYFSDDMKLNRKVLTLENERGIGVSSTICYREDKEEEIIDKLSRFEPGYIDEFNRVDLGTTKGEERTAYLVFHTNDIKEATAVMLMAYIEELLRSYYMPRKMEDEAKEIEKAISSYTDIHPYNWHHRSSALIPSVCDYKHLGSVEMIMDPKDDIDKVLKFAADDIEQFFDEAVLLEITSEPTAESKWRLYDKINRYYSEKHKSKEKEEA